MVRGEVGGVRAVEGFAHAREVDGRELVLGGAAGGVGKGVESSLFAIEGWGWG